MWILYVQLGLELLKIMQNKEKGEGLDKNDIYQLAEKAAGMGMISPKTKGEIVKSSPVIKEILEGLAGLIKRD